MLGVTCVKFLRVSPNLVAYAVKGEGVFIQKTKAMSFDKPIAEAKIEPDDTIWDIHEHRYMEGSGDIPSKKPEYFLVAIGSRYVHILYDKHQGEFGNLSQVDRQMMAVEMPRRPSTYCEFTSKVFFADEHEGGSGGLIRSMQPRYITKDDYVLDYRVVYDLKSKLLHVTALKARWSRSLQHCMLYVGLSSGDIILLKIRYSQGEKVEQYSVFSQKADPVEFIDFISAQKIDNTSHRMFMIVAASTAENTPIVFLGATSLSHKQYSRDAVGISSPRKDIDLENVLAYKPKMLTDPILSLMIVDSIIYLHSSKQLVAVQCQSLICCDGQVKQSGVYQEKLLADEKDIGQKNYVCMD